MPNYLNKIIYLTEAQKNTLFSTGTVTANGQTITYNENDLYFTTDGILPVSGGGTGANTASSAIQNLIGSTAIGNSSTPVYWNGSAFVNTSNIPAADDHKWNDVTLSKTGGVSGVSWFVPILSSRTDTTAYLLGTDSSPASQKIAVFDSNSSLHSNTPAAGDNSNAVATTAFVTAALANFSTTDTKNTAGSTDTSSKIFLIGATSQADNSQTYSDNEVYATNGVLTVKTLNSTSLTASQAVSTDANKNLVSTNLYTADPTASGTGISYIASVSQSAVGKITATKSTVRSASTSQTGVVQLNDSISNTSTTVAATANAVKRAYDLANTANTKYYLNTSVTFNATTHDATTSPSVVSYNNTANKSIDLGYYITATNSSNVGAVTGTTSTTTSSLTISLNGTSQGAWNGSSDKGINITPTAIGAASLASPGFTGVPTAPTAALGTNTTQLATTEFVQAVVNEAIMNALNAWY